MNIFWVDFEINSNQKRLKGFDGYINRERNFETHLFKWIKRIHKMYRVRNALSL